MDLACFSQCVSVGLFVSMPLSLFPYSLTSLLIVEAVYVHTRKHTHLEPC